MERNFKTNSELIDSFLKKLTIKSEDFGKLILVEQKHFNKCFINIYRHSENNNLYCDCVKIENGVIVNSFLTHGDLFTYGRYGDVIQTDIYDFLYRNEIFTFAIADMFNNMIDFENNIIDIHELILEIKNIIKNKIEHLEANHSSEVTNLLNYLLERIDDPLNLTDVPISINNEL